MKSAREDSSFYKFYNQRRKNIDHRYRNSIRVNQRNEKAIETSFSYFTDMVKN